MNIGAFRHRVSVQTQTETPVEHDEIEESWTTTHRRMPAMIVPLSGRELDSARQIDPRISHAVHFRFWKAYPTDLEGGRCRLVYHPTDNADDDRIFDPVTPPIDVEERHVELIINCRELP